MKRAKKAPVSRLLGLLDSLGSIPSAPSPVDFEDAKLAFREQTEAKASRERGPCGKVMFSSESATKAAIKRRLERGSNASRLRAYFCHECRSWHMSSAFNKY